MANGPLGSALARGSRRFAANSRSDAENRPLIPPCRRISWWASDGGGRKAVPGL